MSHELDYLLWLFKDFEISKIYKRRISNLNISSEDISLIFGKIKKKSISKNKINLF